MVQDDLSHSVENALAKTPNMRFVRVALDLPLSTLFDYKIESEWAIEIGQRVVVPFGRKNLVGVVMECVPESNLAADRVKSVSKVLNEVPPLPQELLALLKFCSDYYHFPLGMVVLAALPARLRVLEPMQIKPNLAYRLTVAGRALDLATLPKRRAVQLRILQALTEAPRQMAQLRALASSASLALNALLE